MRARGKVLLTGASGQIGWFAIPRLISAGFAVIAVSRKGQPDGYPVIDGVEWLTQTEAVRVCGECRYLLSAGPMGVAKTFLAQGVHFHTAVIFSSSSVVTKRESANVTEKTQMQELLALEKTLLAMAENSTEKSAGLKLVIFRPTLVYGCGLDTNISRLANWIHRWGFIPVNGRAAGLRQPVHADDLAVVAVAAMQCENRLPGILPLAGGSTLSYSEMVNSIFAAMGRPPRVLRLPQWLFGLFAQALQVLNPASGINSEMVKRQAIDLIFDDRQARELLNYKPRQFEPASSDFSLPDFDTF